MSTKFGLLIYCDLLKARTSTNTKPEVVLSDRGRHLKNLLKARTSTNTKPEVVLSDRGRHLKKQYDVIFPQ